jgi:hypothetical protein
MLVVLAFGVRWMGACRMESSSLVNRLGSGRAHPHDLGRLHHTCCDEGLVLFWSLKRWDWTAWSGAEEGEDGQHPAVLVG